MSMAIDEAIRINTILMEGPVLKDDPLVVEALKLDNEALKRVRDGGYGLLPGETER